MSRHFRAGGNPVQEAMTTQWAYHLRHRPRRLPTQYPPVQNFAPHRNHPRM